MNLSRKWLSVYTDIKAGPKEYEEVMTMSGSKVELTQDPSQEIKNVVVGRVEQIERHPDSDHLWVCTVNVGRSAPVQIVTGAQNVSQGDLVPAALHKSRLPGGVKIEKGKLRGVKSEGMLCSLSELKLDKHDFPYADEDGIFILEEPCSPGDDIRPVIGADDSIVEFEITNNRPDCLSVIGLARESAVAFGTALNIPEPVVRGSGDDISSYLTVTVSAPRLCPRYTARMARNLKIEPSPKWMRERLRASGVRPINNIVDITNYVMLEYGQPMHAFDYACLDGGAIVVRTAEPGETMNTLDGTSRALSEDMLVIADLKKPVGIAGVMGGENSEITEKTQLLVFESANFNGLSIRKTASALGMRTDASGRFEKGLDIENTYPAVQRACELIELLGAGEVIDGIIDVRTCTFSPVTLPLDSQKINKLLGTDISESFMYATLEKLGFVCENGVVRVPSWRGDIEHYTDLAEEVARFYGFNRIPASNLQGAGFGGYTPRQSLEREISAVCRAVGFSEICTYSFIGPGDYQKIGIDYSVEEPKGPIILNPLGEDTSIMRTTTLPSMLSALAGNHSHRNTNVSLYEIGTVYRECGEKLPDERKIITMGAYGDCDFFRIKGSAEAVLRALRVTNPTYRALTCNPSYHPGRTAEIYVFGELIGRVGQVHPAVCKNYGLPDTYISELDFESILKVRADESVYTPIPRFPSVTRDLAVVCDESVTVQTLSESIKAAGGELLREVSLFDIYTGAPISAGKKSVAFSLTLRSDEKTLTDEMAEAVMKSVLMRLETEHGAVLR